MTALHIQGLFLTVLQYTYEKNLFLKIFVRTIQALRTEGESVDSRCLGFEMF